MDTKEKNVVIAGFAGLEVKRGGVIIKDKNDQPVWKQMLYHSSWDHLMPVCRKIRKLSNEGFGIQGKEISIGFALESLIDYAIQDLDRDKTFEAVFEFAQWYETVKE